MQVHGRLSVPGLPRVYWIGKGSAKVKTEATSIRNYLPYLVDSRNWIRLQDIIIDPSPFFDSETIVAKLSSG